MKRFLPYALTLLLVAGIVPSCATTDEQQAKRFTEEQRRLNAESFIVAWETIRDHHWDESLGGIDWEGLREELLPQIEQVGTEEEYRELMQKLIEPFDQSHFALIPAVTYEELAAPNGAGRRDGVTGIDVRVVDDRALVTDVQEGSPADLAGVETGWRVLRIDGDKVRPVLRRVRRSFGEKSMLPLVQHRTVYQRLAGSIGEEKSVRFRDGDGKKRNLELTLVAEEGTSTRLGSFPVPPIRLKSDKLAGNIGYIAFNGFMDPIRLMPAFEQAIREFMDSEGLVIDIRGNGGGMPVVAMGMAGWLISGKDEYLGTMFMRDTELRFVINPRLETYDGPVAVLIDGSSASCSEIFAGGLRDIGRARLFGTTTAGAVLPAQWRPLPNGDFLYYPVADYISKNGQRLEAVGVEPDVHAVYARQALLEGRDVALEAAKTWIHSQTRP